MSPPQFAQPSACVIGSQDSDTEGARLRRAWLDASDLWYEDDHADLAVTDEDETIWADFLELVVAAAWTLHSSGALKRCVGRDIPILIDAELGDDQEMRELNRSANPAQFHADLDRWTNRSLA